MARRRHTEPNRAPGLIDWDDILAVHGPAVWRGAYRLLGNADDADDCLQGVFLAALKTSRRQTVRDWPALLKTLAANWAVDRLRRRVHRGEWMREDPPLAGLTASTPPPDQAAQTQELSERLRSALGQLPKRQAQVFCLCCIEGWAHSQVGEVLGLRTSHVTVLLHRARNRLRELLAPAAIERDEREVSP